MWLGAKLRLNGGGASPGISLSPGSPGHAALSAEVIVRLSRIESIPPRVHEARGFVHEQIAGDAILHEGVVNRQKLATFVEEQMTAIGVLGNTHSEAPLHFSGIQRDLLDDVRDLVAGRTWWNLFVIRRKGLRARTGTVRRDRARTGIP